MKTNPLTSLLNKARTALCPCAPQFIPTCREPVGAFKEVRSPGRTIACPGAQPNSPASLAEGGGGKGAGGGLGTQPQRNKEKFAKYLIPAAILLLFFLLLSLVACKSPATLTNDTQHYARDSNYHATVHRIETHDTIIIGTPSVSPLKGEYSSLPLREGQGGSKSPFKGDLEGLEGQVLVRISDRTITLHDTVFILRTDTLLRTQTITQKERYIPPFYRFCTISLATLATLATLVFYIRLILRYRKIRSPT